MAVPARSVKDINIIKNGNIECLLGHHVLKINRPGGLSLLDPSGGIKITPRLNFLGNKV